MLKIWVVDINVYKLLGSVKERDCLGDKGI
jgi:hypothetical protein